MPMQLGQRGNWAARQSQGAEQRDADVYRAAIEKAAYRDAGMQYGQGLGTISNSLAAMGPLSDSGAGTALRSRLANSIYGSAASRVGNSYADFMGRMMEQRRQYAYQLALMKQQQKMQQTGFGGVAGGIAGGVFGSALGPVGTAIGQGIGRKIGGVYGQS